MRKPILFLLLSVSSVLAQPPAGDWKPFSPKDGAFSIQMPGTPNEHKKAVKSGSGATEVILFEVPVPPGENTYAVGYSEYPKDSIKAGTEDKRLDNARDAAKTTAKGKLKREKSLLLEAYPGREILIEIDDKKAVKVRLYAVNNRLYEIVAVGSPEFVASAETAKFLESFKLGK
ncbi:MAG TPA: hypothetical protein VE988_01345 [Gemmataceae bacterium]|nr:hypothetical protein [Gemmataceae bacterium]